MLSCNLWGDRSNATFLIDATCSFCSCCHTYGKANRLTADWTICFRFLEEAGIPFSSAAFTLAVWATPSLMPWVPRIKRPKYKAHHSAPPTTEAKSFRSLLLHALTICIHSMVLRHRNKFTVSLPFSRSWLPTIIRNRLPCDLCQNSAKTSDLLECWLEIKWYTLASVLCWWC
jgi:hypothetical protein